ncbi:hypothetical protein AB0D08_28120 [Kitasatospora sp. NPDC048540]|uniref:hypothetical protein n=1 Tax=unclassified Kitasatospora TaxID=2633591 RepID=UPI0005398CAB|nr:hypothetical protein [Kitasatospora sp. MBT63]
MTAETGAGTDADGWESRHRAAYGCGSWERACAQGAVLTAWHQEQDPLAGAATRRGPSGAPGSPPSRPKWPKWPWGSGPHTVALVFWQAAYEAGILVDQVPLADAVRRCGTGSGPPAAGPLPEAGLGGGVGFGSPESVAGVGPILRAHATADLPRPRPAGTRLTLGHRVRELRATPDWDGGDWPAALARARRAMQRADDLREQGIRHPTAAERACCGRLRLDRAPARGPATWRARASYLVDLATRLSAAADSLPGDDRGEPGPAAQVLGAVAGACALLSTAVEEIDHLWAAEPQEPADPAGWELLHVPGPLLTQTEETEDLVQAASVFLWLLACS